MSPENQSPPPASPAPAEPPSGLPPAPAGSVVSPQTAGPTPQMFTPSNNVPPPQPPVPVFTPGPPGTLIGQADPQASPAAQPSSKRKRLLAAVAVVVLIVIVGVVGLKLIKQPITEQQLTTAITAANSFNTSSTNAGSDLTSAENDSTLSSFNSDTKNAASQLANAVDQFSILKKSNVLSNGKVKAAFNSFSAPWGTYDTYLGNEITDIKGFYPPFLNFGNQFTTIANATPPTTAAELTAFLSSILSTVNTAKQQLAGLHELNPGDQKLLAELQSLLQTLSSQYTTAVKDSTSGNQTNVYNDLSTAATAFDNGANVLANDTTAIDNKITQLDPVSSYNKFQSALNGLLTSAKG